MKRHNQAKDLQSDKKDREVRDTEHTAVDKLEREKIKEKEAQISKTELLITSTN